MRARARSGKTSRECGRIIISHQVDRWKSPNIRSCFIFSEHSDRLLESCDGTVLLDDKILIMGNSFATVVTLRRLSTVSYVHDPDDTTATLWTWYWKDEHGYWREYGLNHTVRCYPILHQEKRHCSLDSKFSEALCSQIMPSTWFRSHYCLRFSIFFSPWPSLILVNHKGVLGPTWA